MVTEFDDDSAPTLDELRALYRWWTLNYWWNEGGCGFGGVKIGPLTIAWYRWFDERWRVGVSFNFSAERIIVGGPLK